MLAASSFSGGLQIRLPECRDRYNSGRILTDQARARQSHKRGGGAQPISLDAAPMVSAKPQPEVLAIDAALKALAKVDSRKSQVVELRYFGGLTSRKLLRFSRIRQ